MTAQTVDKVHLVFKTHLDVGFTNLAERVVASYFESFIPRAIETAAELRRAGGPERFVWTTGSWLIYEYLERATAGERQRLEQAIRAGDIGWHGLPFTTHSELMTPALFRRGLDLARELDRRFQTRTIAAKMTDVPGHTRGIVPLLAEAGIEFLHLGVNAASTPPDVPPAFVWQDPGGAQVIVLYQKGSYGDLSVVPGLSEALAFAHTGDNLGPQSPEQVRAAYQHVRERLPYAEIVGSTLNAFAEQLRRVKDQLPVVTQELGDTWIHGAGSDPLKISQFRALSRLYTGWLADGRARQEASAVADFSRRLLMVPEHTWGMDQKTHLPDTANYRREQFAAARRRPDFKAFEASWAEQRGYLRDALDALGDSPLAREARDCLAALAPARPSMAGFTPVADPAGPLTARHFALGFGADGAITSLKDSTGRDWAGGEHPIALFKYQTFSQQDYDRFRRQYSVNKRETAVWAIPDFTKPGIAAAGAVSATWRPRLAGMYQRRAAAGQEFLLELAMPDECTSLYGCPAVVTLELRLPDDEPAIYLTLQWFDKPANRLPEALWLSFVPRIADPRGWSLDKLGERISPLDVIRDGNRKLHAVDAGVFYRDKARQLSIETLDAPLVAPGEPSLLNFSNRQPALKRGMHFNLYNNVWGTNFPMWYEDDARFRFSWRVSRAS
jgi:hypothetical protein